MAWRLVNGNELCFSPNHPLLGTCSKTLPWPVGRPSPFRALEVLEDNGNHYGLRKRSSHAAREYWSGLHRVPGPVVVCTLACIDGRCNFLFRFLGTPRFVCLSADHGLGSMTARTYGHGCLPQYLWACVRQLDSIFYTLPLTL